MPIPNRTSRLTKSLHPVGRAAAFAAAAFPVFIASAQQPDPAEQFRRQVARQHASPAAPVDRAEGVVTARDVAFPSRELGREMRYRALLPASYGRSHRHYPVLYLLHGFLNPYYEWDKQTRLAELLGSRDLVVILVEGDNSFYLNSAGEPKDRYMSYFFRDVLPDVQSRFRVMSETHGQALAGVSMGGYGALLYALRFPGTFAFVGSFAGVPNLMSDKELLGNFAPFDIEKLLGPPGGPTRTQNDVMALARKVTRDTPLPYLFLDVGTDDPFAPHSLDFAAILREKGARHELHLTPGGHEWDVWDRMLPTFFDSLGRVVAIDRR